MTKDPWIARFTTKQINQIRKRDGLPPIEHVIKACMACGKSFESEGAHNRLCTPCRSKDAEGFGTIG